MAGLSTGNGLPNAVVTGVAMSTALATDAESTWKKLVDGQGGIPLAVFESKGAISIVTSSPCPTAD